MSYIGVDSPIALTKNSEIEVGAITTSMLNASVSSVPSGTIERSSMVMYGFKNKIINGNFSVWQRGTTFSSTGYSADRWWLGIAGTGTTAILTDHPLDTEASESATGINIIYTGGASADAQVRISQKIEGVRTCAGKRIALSFLADSLVGNAPIGIEFTQEFGGGGSATITGIGARKLIVSQSATHTLRKYTVIVDIPSIAGKSIGTDGEDGLSLNLWVSAGSAYAARASNIGQQASSIVIADLQVEEGDAPTMFEYRPNGTEAYLCYRYYQKIAATNNQAAVIIYASKVLHGRWQFITKMRKIPTITLESTSWATRGVTEPRFFEPSYSNYSISPTLTGVAAANITTSSTAFTYTGSGTTYGVVGVICPYQSIAMYVNAEM
jgi:hypothetical protein